LESIEVRVLMSTIFLRGLSIVLSRCADPTRKLELVTSAVNIYHVDHDGICRQKEDGPLADPPFGGKDWLLRYLPPFRGYLVKV
jgi:hypothetical protein